MFLLYLQSPFYFVLHVLILVIVPCPCHPLSSPPLPFSALLLVSLFVSISSCFLCSCYTSCLHFVLVLHVFALVIVLCPCHLLSSTPLPYSALLLLCFFVSICFCFFYVPAKPPAFIFVLVLHIFALAVVLYSYHSLSSTPLSYSALLLLCLIVSFGFCFLCSYYTSCLHFVLVLHVLVLVTVLYSCHPHSLPYSLPSYVLLLLCLFVFCCSCFHVLLLIFVAHSSHSLFSNSSSSLNSRGSLTSSFSSCYVAIPPPVLIHGLVLHVLVLVIVLYSCHPRSPFSSMLCSVVAMPLCLLLLLFLMFCF